MPPGPVPNAADVRRAFDHAPWPQSKQVLNSKSRSCAIPPLFMNVWMQSTWATLISDVTVPW